MHISWHGQYTVKIQSDETILILDPYAPDVGLSPFRGKANLVALTNPTDPSMSHTAAIQGDPIVINTPGEYSINGFTLHAMGWHTTEQAERSVQRWLIEGITLLHIGALNRDLTAEELQELEKTNIDVLLLPVGGGSGLNAAQAQQLLTTVEPRVVIPIHFALPKLREKLDGIEIFASELGVSTKDAQPKLIIKANKLPQDELTTVILKP